MKVSVSLPGDDLRFLDEYARTAKLGSRSAVVHKAVELLRASELGVAYEAAWEDWVSEDADAWETTAGDGIDS